MCVLNRYLGMVIDAGASDSHLEPAGDASIDAAAYEHRASARRAAYDNDECKSL